MTGSTDGSADLTLGAVRAEGSILGGETGDLNSADVRRFKAYRAYKDSGVEWLGEIPSHWSTRRLKYVADGPIKNGIGEAGAYDDPEWPRYVRITDIAGPRALRNDTFKSLPPELARQAPFRIGDLLLAAVGATFGKSYLHIADIGQVCFAGYLVRVSPSREVDSSFVAYWTESAPYWGLVQSRVVQATIQNFSAAKYRDLAIPLPTLAEQRAITAFLDRETARIDALVAKKERLIELLQEKRAALTTQAVTKGLDPGVPMKDSGVKWLGNIPAHWDVGRLRNHIASLEQGWSPLCENRPAEGDEWGVLKVGCVNNAAFNEAENKALPRDISVDASLEIRPGDILLSRANTRELLGSAVRVGEVRPRLLLCDKLYRLKLSPQGMRPRFLVHQLGATTVRYQLEREATGASGSMQNIAQETIRNLVLTIPPLPEQDVIANFIEERQATFESVASKTRDAIERLKELRTALISAAVAGKIDVRNEAAA